MNTLLTPTPASGTITQINPPAASRCGLNETGICCKESDTAHTDLCTRGRSPRLLDG
jgi:hypothetical protein